MRALLNFKMVLMLVTIALILVEVHAYKLIPGTFVFSHGCVHLDFFFVLMRAKRSRT